MYFLFPYISLKFRIVSSDKIKPRRSIRLSFRQKPVIRLQSVMIIQLPFQYRQYHFTLFFFPRTKKDPVIIQQLLGACVAEDSKQIVSCLEFGLDKQLVPKWNYDLWVMLSTLDFVNVKEGKVDSKRILALKTRIQGYFANSPSILKRLDPYFEKFN